MINIFQKIQIIKEKGYFELGRYLSLFSGQRVLANARPKAGTYLLKRVLSLLPGIYEIPIFINYFDKVNWEKKEEILKNLGRGRFVMAHIPYSQEFANFLASLDFKTFLIIRDPRDILVSLWHFLFLKKNSLLRRNLKLIWEKLIEGYFLLGEIEKAREMIRKAKEFNLFFSSELENRLKDLIEG